MYSILLPIFEAAGLLLMATVIVIIMAPMTPFVLPPMVAIGLGFYIVKEFMQRRTYEVSLQADWKRHDTFTETKGIARIVGAIFSFGFTEMTGAYHLPSSSKIFDNEGTFLGCSISEAIYAMKDRGDEYFKDGDYGKAIDCLLMADENCTDLSLHNEMMDTVDKAAVAIRNCIRSLEG